jgi:hypothetical protein
MRTSLALAAVLFITTPAAAESLLVEFHHSGNSNHYAWGQRVPFEFSTYYDFHTVVVNGYLGGLIGSADIGNTYSVDPSEIADFQMLLTEPRARFTFYSAQNSSKDFDMTEFWTVTHHTLTDVNYFVPQLGPGLTGYRITNITQTIDALTQIGGASTVVTRGEQTIRIYGEVLPPPPVYPPLAGDYNKNGTVDTADYVVWRHLMGMPLGSRPDLPNAINGPRPPDVADHFIWRRFYGESVPPIGAAAVPEPASWLLTCLALCCVCKTKR